jgi:hypothetical protein
LVNGLPFAALLIRTEDLLQRDDALSGAGPRRQRDTLFAGRRALCWRQNSAKRVSLNHWWLGFAMVRITRYLRPDFC